MPPKKRARATAREEDDTALAATPGVAISPKAADSHDPNDLWTDEQETSLLKGVIQWKPAGMHRHFRMVAISTYLRSHGYDPRHDMHTAIPNIWRKLESQYNLEDLNAREDFDSIEETSPWVSYKSFRLPLGEYGPDMMDRGRDLDRECSPPVQELPLDEIRSESLPVTKKRKAQRGKRSGTIEDTDEPGTSPAPSSIVKTASKRGRPRAVVETVEDPDDVEQDDEEDAEEEDGEEDDDDNQNDEDEATPLRRPRGRPPGGARAASKPRKSARKR